MRRPEFELNFEAIEKAAGVTFDPQQRVWIIGATEQYLLLSDFIAPLNKDLLRTLKSGIRKCRECIEFLEEENKIVDYSKEVLLDALNDEFVSLMKFRELISKTISNLHQVIFFNEYNLEKSDHRSAGRRSDNHLKVFIERLHPIFKKAGGKSLAYWYEDATIPFDDDIESQLNADGYDIESRIEVGGDFLYMTANILDQINHPYTSVLALAKLINRTLPKEI